MERKLLAVAAFVAWLAQDFPARADDASTAPWAEGVTQAQQDEAQRLLELGNARFLDKQYGEALAQYRLALAQWDHPAIRFNVVRCLIQMDKPVEAFENLELALVYGAAALDDTVYAEALTYEKLLRDRIAEVEVTCTEPDATISLDGQPLLVCPGTARQRIAPGRHELVARKDGFLTRTVEVVGVASEPVTVAVELVPLSDVAVVSRRWPAWTPWAVLGVGGAAVVAGGLVKLEAESNRDEGARVFADQCATGCSGLPPEVAALYERADRQDDLAIGLVIGGAATVIAGVVLAVLNRPRTIYPDRDGGVRLALGANDGGAEVSLGIRF